MGTYVRSLFAALLACFAVAAVAQAQPASVVETHEGYIDANGVMIYYETIGHGAPLVVLHGGPGGTHDGFLPYLLPLARTHMLVLIDERGCGHSSRLEDPKGYTVENNVADVEAVREALHLGTISLLGHSAGGVFAEKYALTYPAHLSHLVLVSTFASTRSMNRILASIKNNLPSQTKQRIVELEAAGLFGKGEPWERERYPAEYGRLAWGYGYFPYIYGARPDPNYDPSGDAGGMPWDLYREMWGSDGEFVISGNLRSVEYLQPLHSLHIPTLILVGDHDLADRSLSEEIHEAIAGSKLVVLPHSGHMSFVDQPSLWNDTVQAFLDAR